MLYHIQELEDNIVNMIIIHKLINRFNAFPIKILDGIFFFGGGIKIDKLIPKSIYEGKGPN